MKPVRCFTSAMRRFAAICSAVFSPWFSKRNCTGVSRLRAIASSGRTSSRISSPSRRLPSRRKGGDSPSAPSAREPAARCFRQSASLCPRLSGRSPVSPPLAKTPICSAKDVRCICMSLISLNIFMNTVEDQFLDQETFDLFLGRGSDRRGRSSRSLCHALLQMIRSSGWWLVSSPVQLL